jgi:hypothetical protein
VIDRGAIVAAYVGIGMAVVIAISFLLIIPIEPILWYLALPGGLLIGYYANQRSDRRRGPWGRILLNGVFAGLVTGLTLAALLLGTKALFFAADNGYRDASSGGPLSCAPGGACVYERYVADGRGPDLAAQGVNDADDFGRFYWGQQLTTAGLLIALSAAGGLGGSLLYGVFRPKTGLPTAQPSPG